MISLLQYLINLKKSEKDSENLIRSGKVLVNDEVVFIPSVKIDPQSKVLIKEKSKWVSRGALKLLPFAEEMEIKFQNKSCFRYWFFNWRIHTSCFKKRSSKNLCLGCWDKSIRLFTKKKPKGYFYWKN